MPLTKAPICNWVYEGIAVPPAVLSLVCYFRFTPIMEKNNGGDPDDDRGQ